MADPCRKGYRKVGMKDKDGRRVPNCVPCKDGKPKPEKARLMSMAHAEFAADDWWSRMTPKEQEAYKRSHPRSKYAKQSGDDDARNAANESVMARLRAGTGTAKPTKKVTLPRATKYRSVGPNKADAIEQHMRAGGYVYVPSATRPLSIPGHHWDAWEKMGHKMFKAEGDGYRMRQGKGSVYLLPGQLHTLHDDDGNPAKL